MTTSSDQATTWVEVSAQALAGNYRAVAGHAGVPVCAVVKANGYGHGLVEAARLFEGAGARWLAVTRADEARTLRAAGVAARLLVLTPPPAPAAVSEAVALGCSIALSDPADIDRFGAAARAAGKPAAVHLKVDTGMGRLGVAAADAVAVAERIAASGDLVLEGIFTHFADAAGASGRAQLERFASVRDALGKRAARALVHAANSAALLALPGTRFDMVRIGTLLYGQNPPGASAPFELRDTFAWLARVVAVREVAAGETVGYGSEWKAKRPTRIATLAVGWADGFAVEPRARTESVSEAVAAGARTLAVAAGARPSSRVVWFGDRAARVVGRVGMQTTSVSVDGIPGLAVGSVAQIPARRLLVSPLVERVYVE